MAPRGEIGGFIMDEEFTDLLDKYLAALGAYQVEHGPLWENYLQAKKDLNDFVRGLKVKHLQDAFD